MHTPSPTLIATTREYIFHVLSTLEYAPTKHVDQHTIALEQFECVSLSTYNSTSTPQQYSIEVKYFGDTYSFTGSRNEVLRWLNVANYDTTALLGVLIAAPTLVLRNASYDVLHLGRAHARSIALALVDDEPRVECRGCVVHTGPKSAIIEILGAGTPYSWYTQDKQTLLAHLTNFLRYV
jgi:hypothetical protein